MMLIIELYFITIIVLFVYFYIKERITPVTIFIVSQGVFFFGLLKYLDFNSQEDMKISLIYFVGLLLFGIGAGFGRAVHPIRKDRIEFVSEPLTKRQLLIFKMIIVFSIFLFAWFCYKTNFSTIKIMLSNLLSSNSTDITNARLSSYSVPGTNVIYAFRVTLLPTITVVIIKCNNFSKPYKVLLCVFMIIFSLITGQRAGFFYVMIMWGLSYVIPLCYKKVEGRKEGKRKVIIILTFFVIAFIFLSLTNGRVRGSLTNAIFKRFLDDNQITAYNSFHYIFSKGTCWGRNYYEEMVNLLVPGDKYVPLSKIINEIMYGTMRGTAPPCLWGTVFYNFSWIGVLFFGFLWGFFAQYIGYRLYSKRVNQLRITIYSYLFIDIGMLVAGSPLHLFNNGFVPLFVVALILHADKCSAMVCRDKKYSLNGEKVYE